MKRRKKRNYLIAGMLLLSVCVMGCSSSKSSDATTMESAAAYETYNATEIESYDETGSSTTVSNSEVQATERKLIKTVNMDVETESFNILLTVLENKTEDVGGYIESSNVYNGSNYYDSSKKNASLSIRIPADSLEDFLSSVDQASNVVNQSENVEDITLSYVDLQSHKNALLAEQKSLLELMEKAETVEDIITLEGRLSEVRYQIESMESQLRTMDNQVSYSTVNIQITEVAEYSPTVNRGRGEKIVDGFLGSIKNLWNGLLDFFVAIIILSPYLIFCGIIVLIIILITKLLIKHQNKKQLKKNQSEVGLKKQPTENNTESKGNKN